jgi:hypothetical protein
MDHKWIEETITAENYPEACALLGVKHGAQFQRTSVPSDYFLDLSEPQEGVPV